MTYQKILINKSFAKISNENFETAIEYEVGNLVQNANKQIQKLSYYKNDST